METEVKLPRLGQGMESGTIVRWLKAEGDAVRAGEPLYELDTDKVTQEVEAEADGTLVRILVPTGEVAVGAAIAVVSTDGAGEAPAAAAPSAPAAAPAEPSSPRAVPEAAPPPAAATAPTPPPTGAAAGGGRIKASPLARRIARERGIDLASLVGTGPDGRIVADDVERLASAPVPAAPVPGAPPAEVEVVELTSIRRTIARRLTEAWTAPVFQLGASAEMTEALALREALVAATAEGDVKPTVNDLLVKLAAVALTRNPAVNAIYTGDQIHRYASADVGIAVAAPQGLVVPVVRSADRLSVREIARARADLVGRARENKLTLADLDGGTFSVSNLGMFGVESFTAVLNPPQVAILAVGAVKDEVVVVDGEVDVAPLVRLTLSCDHRAIDGADGARFLQTLVALIEQPGLAL
jgi:pyruvate dehydrogenase E2 component (dihydrolipoamide acetyltransferase)